MASSVEQLGAAALFLLGLDAAYNVGSFSLSAPQTTERRIKDTEGESETPEEAMKWVWISTWKMLGYTAFAAWIGGSLWPLFGGAVVVADLHLSYRYAIRCGEQAAGRSPVYSYG